MSSSTTTNGSTYDETSTSNGFSNGAAAATAGITSPAMSPISPNVGAANGEERLQELETLFTEGPESANQAKAFSTETLLDILLLLYNECCNSSLRKEKTVTDFIELGKLKNPSP